jgi:hypothetical protein
MTIFIRLALLTILPAQGFLAKIWPGVNCLSEFRHAFRNDFVSRMEYAQVSYLEI